MYSDYEFSEEYRNRFAFNKGERYWMSEAFNFYKKEVQAQLQKDIERGNPPIVMPIFFDQFFKDIENKLDMWMQKERKYEEEDVEG